MKTGGFKKILLATDGSDQATAAVGVTRCFAHASGAVVRVVHVWNLEVHHRHGVWDVEMRSEAERLINLTVKKLRAAGIDADGEIVRADSGHVAAALTAEAKHFEADLVVVGSRGLSEWQAMIQHSTSHQLLSSVDCPLLVVRSTTPAATHDAQRVLLAVAGGDDVAPAVQAAVAAAAAPGSEVMVVHVKQSVVGFQGYAYVEPEDQIRVTMKTAISLLKAAGISAQTMVAHAGPVAQTVSELAANWNADVIVLGSSRIGDLGSLVLGSVTHDLLRTTQRPVLIAERIRS
jgi:nucleotide-binding universal stress UspA family protein